MKGVYLALAAVGFMFALAYWQDFAANRKAKRIREASKRRMAKDKQS